MLRISMLTLVLIAAATYPLARVDGPAAADQGENDPPRVIAWNDLGMHCLDPDFSVFAILPPFNTVNAHLLIGGEIQGAAQGYGVTYEAIADPNASVNSTSIGKTNFWDHEDALFGVQLPLDVGLAGFAMPGPANVPQAMGFAGAYEWFQAEGIPMTPIDDAGVKNPYPLMRVVARNAAGSIVAETITTVPNSRELTCDMCHASGANPFARPSSGWANEADPLRDDRLNILLLHDEHHLGTAAYDAALAAGGYDPEGLHHTAVVSGRAVLCAGCHASNALPGTGMAGITAMTVAVHGMHADARTPNGLRLDDDPTRTSCFACHPGLDTQCLRGAMGKAIGADGRSSMHCQSCHGEMAAVGDPGRVGWLEEPTCQGCHSGTATNNAGAIRFTSVFDANGDHRVPASSVFATEPDVPSAGFSLYRFSRGHGGLQCAACHGPPHAIYPTALPNDNEQSMLLQGHVGTISDCSTCHGNLEDDELLMGAHGMHPADRDWATDKHGDHAQSNLGACRSCHGAALRGTELSRAQGDRVFQTEFGQKTFWRGFQVGCWDCHEGPNDDDRNHNAPPAVANVAVATPNDVDLPLALTASDPEGAALTFRIVSQPEFRTGTVAIQGSSATFLPEPGFVGTTFFTYAAHDGDTWSNLGTVTVSVGPASCAGSAEEYGFGSPGAGGFIGHLSADGCPTPGGSVTLNLDGVLGGGFALFVVGTTRAHDEVLPGWVVHVGGIFAATPLMPVGGSGPGAGALSSVSPIPAATPPLTVTLQAFVTDPAAPAGWATSNGLELSIR